MRIPWAKSKVEQLELVDEGGAPSPDLATDAADDAVEPEIGARSSELSLEALDAQGVPLLVPLDNLEEDPGNPRTQFLDEELAELAEDVSYSLIGVL